MLGGHETGRAHDRAVTGAFGCAGGGITVWCFFRLAQDFGNAPIHDQYFPEFADHDVGRLEVPVNDAFGMGIGNGIAGFAKDIEQPRERIPVDGGRLALTQTVQHFLEGGAAHKFHGVIIATLGIHAEIVDWYNMRVIQSSEDEGFLSEAVGEIGVGGNLRRHHLEGHVPLELVIEGQIHFSHAAFGQLPRNLVALGVWVGSRFGGGGVFQQSQLERGAAQGNGLAGLYADLTRDLAVIDKGPITTADILYGATFGGDGELSVFAGNVGAGEVNGARGIAADGVIARNQIKSSQSLAAAGRGQLNDWRRHGNLLAASCPPRGQST